MSGTTSSTVSVLIASAQSVAKVYTIGAVGFFAVKFPRKMPFFPRESVGIVARMCFNVLLLPLVYSTTAVSVTIDSIGDYWFVLVGAFYVMFISYLTATFLNHAFPCCMRLQNPRDFRALRISVTFPNIVALPILIFPSLCEYPVVYQRYILPLLRQQQDTSTYDNSELKEQCVSISTTLIFVYFFSWSLLFWSFGWRELVAAAQLGKQNTNNDNVSIDDAAATTHSVGTSLHNNINRNNTDHNHHQHSSSHLNDSTDVGNAVRAFDATSESIVTMKDDDANNEDQDVVPVRVIRSKTDVSITCNVTKDCKDGDDCDSVASSQHGYQLQEEGRCSGGEQQHGDDGCGNDTERSTGAIIETDGKNNYRNADNSTSTSSSSSSCWSIAVQAVKHTLTSPGFLMLLAGFITGLIAPLRAALFETGGALRFLGSALETLGAAGSPLSTIVCAASLVPPPSSSSNHSATTNSSTSTQPAAEDSDNNHDHNTEPVVSRPNERSSSFMIHDENPMMSDPNYGPLMRQRRRSSLIQFKDSVRRRSSRFFKAVVPRSSREQNKLVAWFTLSRLIISPGIVVGTIAGLDCANVLCSVPALAKLVVIINACMPGAQIVVVMLKSKQGLEDTANAVANVYLPTYIISIVTIAAWSAVGLWITLPGDDGTPQFCKA